MSKVLVDREWLKQLHRDLDACQKVIWSGLRGADPAYCQDAQARLKEIDELLAQPAEADGVEVIAYATPGNDGDWQMLFFDEKEAFLYVDDERPAPLILQSDHLAALSAVTAERDRLRDMINSANGFQDVLERERDQLRAELETVKKVAYGNLELLDENAKLRDEVEGLRKDAERYRMFRRGMFDPDRFDADIDAIAASTNKESKI